MLAVTTDEAFTLVSSYRWDTHRLQDAYFEDPAKCRATSGCSGPSPPPLPPGTGATLPDPLSLEDHPVEEMDALACGHFFSGPASWTPYLSDAVADFTTATLAQCPASGEGCTERVAPRLFFAHLPPAPSPLPGRYRTAIARAFVEKDPFTRWCPAPGCEFCVECKTGGYRSVLCAAGHAWCWRCQRAPHGPALCADVERWLKREGDSGEDAKWMLAHTKPCPKCRKAIEKNQGW
jgi:ariadne-1